MARESKLLEKIVEGVKSATKEGIRFDREKQAQEAREAIEKAAEQIKGKSAG